MALDRIMAHLKKNAKISISQHNYNKAMAAVSACASLQYEMNQVYSDQDLEDIIKNISNLLLHEKFVIEEANDKVVLFYDGFGLDTRGLALIYLKALIKLRYQVIYVTNNTAEGNQPGIDKIVDPLFITRVYISSNGKYSTQVEALKGAFEKYRPKTAFLYTQPHDVAGVMVFGHYAASVTRFQINLTDHAFWLGVNAFDYCIEFRDYGAIISNKYRNVVKGKITKLPYYPHIDPEIEFAGFPFELGSKKVIFSGGSLYKTFGGDDKYYEIVDAILKKHHDVVFLYAGSGDDSKLKILYKEYPDKVFWIAERRDLYEVIKHSFVYLNTYPIIGALMTQYAAAAGKVPIILKHYNDSDGVLINQSDLGIEYNNVEDLLFDLEKMLESDEYIKIKESKLKDSIVTESEFQEQLYKLIEFGDTKYSLSYYDIDTKAFRLIYLQRLKCRMAKMNSIATLKNRTLIFNFPLIFMRKAISELIRQLF